MIDKTVLSLIHQPCTDELEIVLVNDGSTDNSKAVCEKYASDYSFIRVINKPNGGVASARNVGIENAKGKYLAFLDCDDWWNNDFFDDTIAEELKNSNIDIYGFSYCATNSNCKYEKIYRVCEETKYYRDHQFGRFNWFHHCSLLFSRSFLMANDLRYPSTKLVEDRCFCERCFYWIKSYKAIDKCIFTYWFNSNSIVHTSDGEMFFTENYKGFSMNKKYFNNLDVEYDIEYSVCMLFCSYIKSLCCQYSFKQVEAKVEKDERLRPIRRYKEIGLSKTYYEVIDGWFLNPHSFYHKCRLKERPKELMKRTLIKSHGLLRDVFEYVEFRVIRHYNKV